MRRTSEPFDPRAQLRAVGRRVTAPRVAVLGAVAAHPHSDADRVAAAVREELGAVSTQAVYDVLKACVGAGLLRRIGDDHHHLVCRNCGAVTDVDCVAGSAACLEPSDAHGYVVDEAEVTFRGLCADCREP